MHTQTSSTPLRTQADLPEIRQILPDWNVVDPGLELRVKELLPFVSHMKHQGAAQEEMFEAKTCCHTTEVEQIPAGDWKEVIR